MRRIPEMTPGPKRMRSRVVVKLLDIADKDKIVNIIDKYYLSAYFNGNQFNIEHEDFLSMSKFMNQNKIPYEVIYKEPLKAHPRIVIDFKENTPQDKEKMSEAKLVKVEVFNDGNSWSMQWKGQTYVHRGDIESFSKTLRKIKAIDIHKDPKSHRELTYKQMASEIANGSDRYIWVWEHMLKKLYEEKETKDNVIEITEETHIPKTNIILEVGDKIKIFESMQREAFIFKAKDQKWYYFIAFQEFGEYPDGQFYGPFSTEDEASSHMMMNHSNPGGFWVDDSGSRKVPKDAIFPEVRYGRY